MGRPLWSGKVTSGSMPRWRKTVAQRSLGVSARSLGRSPLALFEHLSAKDLAFHRKSAALIVVQQNSFLAELLLEHFVFRAEVFDHLLLLTVDPASKDHQHQLPRL